MIGAWIPLRLLYFQEDLLVDRLVDVMTLGLVILYYSFRTRSDQQKVRSESFVGRLLFFSDAATAIPFDLIFAPAFGPKAQVFLLVKLLILKRLSFIKSLLDAFSNMHPIVYRLLPILFFLPMLVHLVACGWIAFGSGTAGPDADHLAEYIKAVYWAVTTLTTVGYGDISAKTPVQMIYAATTQVLGVGVFGFVLSNVASLLGRLDAAREHHMSILDRIETYMGYNALPKDLRLQIRSYYRYLWETRHGYEDQDILQTLPPKLRSDVSLHLNKDIIEKVPILNGAEEDLVRDLVSKLAPKILVPGEKVFHVDEPGDAMYFVHTGRVEILSRENSPLAVLPAGSFFGEMALLTNNPRSATARAITYCDLFVLSREDFEKVLNRYPHFAHHVHEVAASRIAGNNSGKAA